MDKIIVEIPTIYRKEEAIEFIEEFEEYNSYIHGSSKLGKYKKKYEDWLIRLVDDCSYTRRRVPARTMYLVREDDNKIIGIFNIRLELNDKLRNTSANIGFSVRPEERNKGYGKVALYYAVKEYTKHNIDTVLISCYRKNIPGIKVILGLGAKYEKEVYDEKNDDYLDFYTMSVSKTVDKYKDIYE